VLTAGGQAGAPPAANVDSRLPVPRGVSASDIPESMSDNDPKKLVTPGELLDAGIVVFQTLPQPMRAWAIIGCYMGQFALMENTLARQLGFVLKLDDIASAVVGRNMGLIEKVRALRTVTNIAAGAGSELEWVDGLLKRAEKAAGLRNVVAHTPFGASTASGGVVFFAVEAKGHFRHPNSDWSLEEAERHITELEEIEVDLSSERAASVFKRARDILARPGPEHPLFLRELLGPEPGEG
jgi:hypothetical protein